MGLISCGGSSAPGGGNTGPAPGAAAADLVLVGGNIMTMDSARPRASALAVAGGRIAAVGSDDEIQPYIASTTRVVNLDGRSVTPGLVDGHAHLYGLGVALESISLRGVSSEAAAVEVIAEAAGRWMRRFRIIRWWCAGSTATLHGSTPRPCVSPG